MNAGFENQHFVCSKYRVVGFADVTLAEFLSFQRAFNFIRSHCFFYKRRIYVDLYLNGKLHSSELYYTES